MHNPQVGEIWRFQIGNSYTIVRITDNYCNCIVLDGTIDKINDRYQGSFKNNKYFKYWYKLDEKETNKWLAKSL